MPRASIRSVGPLSSESEDRQNATELETTDRLQFLQTPEALPMSAGNQSDRPRCQSELHQRREQNHPHDLLWSSDTRCQGS